MKLLKRQQDAFVTCVGYSSVIFGWMAYLAVTAGKYRWICVRSSVLKVSTAIAFHADSLSRLTGSSMSIVVFGMAIPSHVYPWLALVITSVIIPQASFVGHLAGVLAGAYHA